MSVSVSSNINARIIKKNKKNKENTSANLPRMQPLISVRCSVHYWVSCAINKGGFFWDCICVDTHLPRFEALAYVLPHFDALTHVVIRVSWAFIFQTFAEVCYSVFVQVFSNSRQNTVCLIVLLFSGRRRGGVQQTRGHQKSCVLSYLKTKINRCIFQEKFSSTLSSYSPPPPPPLLVSFLL